MPARAAISSAQALWRAARRRLTGHIATCPRREDGGWNGWKQPSGTVNHGSRGLIASAWSKAQDAPGRAIGTMRCTWTATQLARPSTARTASSQGTHDWEYGERTIEPEKPIRNINAYLFRGDHGHGSFATTPRLADDPDTNLLLRGGFEAAGDAPPSLEGRGAERR
jgi:hypothetical protein